MLKAIKGRARWNIARFVYVYLQEYFPRLFHVFIYREILGPIKLNMVMITLYGNFLPKPSAPREKASWKEYKHIEIVSMYSLLSLLRFRQKGLASSR